MLIEGENFGTDHQIQSFGFDSYTGLGEPCEDEQSCSTDFQNANRKLTQHINIIASVLKAMGEMGNGVIKNWK